MLVFVIGVFQPVVGMSAQLVDRHGDFEHLQIVSAEALRKALLALDRLLVGNTMANITAKLGRNIVLECLDGALDDALFGRAIGVGCIRLDVQIVEQSHGGDSNKIRAIVGFDDFRNTPFKNRAADQEADSLGARCLGKRDDIASGGDINTGIHRPAAIDTKRINRRSVDHPHLVDPRHMPISTGAYEFHAGAESVRVGMGQNDGLFRFPQL